MEDLERKTWKSCRGITCMFELCFYWAYTRNSVQYTFALCTPRDPLWVAMSITSLTSRCVPLLCGALFCCVEVTPPFSLTESHGILVYTRKSRVSDALIRPLKITNIKLAFNPVQVFLRLGTTELQGGHQLKRNHVVFGWERIWWMISKGNKIGREIPII